MLDIIFAEAYGINEALGFAKLYRLEEKWQGHIDDDGNKWVRLTYDEWHIELPFLKGRNTVIRMVESMEKQNLILSATFTGRSKWYRCNPEYVSTQNGYSHLPKMGIQSTQNGQLPRVHIQESIPIKEDEEESPNPQNSNGLKLDPELPTDSLLPADITLQTRRVTTLWNSNINISESPIILQQMMSDEYLKLPYLWWHQAVNIAAGNNARKWSYVKAILDKSTRQGVPPEQCEQSWNGKHKNGGNHATNGSHTNGGTRQKNRLTEDQQRFWR